MNLVEFLEKYNYAPYDLYEVAELLADIKDSSEEIVSEEIVSAAKSFLEAEGNLKMILDKIGFEFG